jgi:hypothetical protein
MAENNLSQPHPTPEPKAQYAYGLTQSQFVTIRNLADALQGVRLVEMALGRIAEALEDQKLGGAR